MNAMGQDAIGALAQLGNQSIGQSIGYGISARLASNAWDKWKDSLTRGPKYARIGMERAGFNPILALTGGRMPGGGGVKIQGSMPSPYGAPNMTTGSARQLMELQGQAAVSQSNAADESAKLSATRAAALEGEVAKARALAEFLQTEDGKAWVRRGFVNQSTPQSLGGSLGKGLFEWLPNQFEAFKDFYNQNRPKPGNDDPKKRKRAPFGVYLDDSDYKYR